MLKMSPFSLMLVILLVESGPNVLELKNKKRHQAPLTLKSDTLPTSRVCGQKKCENVFQLNGEIPVRNVDVLMGGARGAVGSLTYLKLLCVAILVSAYSVHYSDFN